MVKQLTFKILLLLSVCLCFIDYVNAQIWREIIPLESTKTDVNKLKLDEQRLQNGSSFFNLQNNLITIKYYKTGCGVSEEKKLELLPALVIEMKNSPKKKPSLMSILEGTISNYEVLNISNNRNIYVDYNTGFVIVAESSIDTQQIVTEMYYLPKKFHKLPTCLTNKWDPIIQEVLKLSKKIAQDNNGTYFYNSIYLSPPTLSNWTIEQITAFSNILKESKNSKGYIIIYTKKDSKPDEAEFWIQKIKNQLLKNTKELPIFINGGQRKTTQANLFILPKSIEGPTPTNLPN